MRAARLTLASLMVAGGLLAIGEADAVTGVVFNSANGHYYKLYTTLSTFSNARNAAGSVEGTTGGYLASVTSSAENQFIYSAGLAVNTPWIGATDETTENTWTWVSGETWSYSNWGSGEPNNSGNEDYVTMRSDGFWNDWSSTGTAYYIVEWNYDPNLPADPANLRATTVTQQQISLAWDDQSNSETGFELEKAIGAAGSFSLLSQPTTNVTSFTDTNVTAEALYRYRIRAVNAQGASGWSNTLSVGTAPPPPSEVSANALTANSVQVGWTDNSSAETSFEVERGAGSPGQNFVALGSAGANATGYTDNTVVPETTYSYRVRASGAAGKSTWSGEASVTTPLASPKALTLEAPVDTSVHLTWEDQSSSETGFEIQRGLGCPAVTFTTIATNGANDTDFDDDTVLPQQVYSYRLRTINASGVSAWSTPTCVTTPPFAPTNAVATALSANRVRVTWTKNTTIATGQQIERGPAGSGIFIPLAAIAANVAQYDDTTAGQETSYTYRVAATGASGRSGWAVTPDVDAPAMLVIRKAGVSRAKAPAKLTVSGEFDVGGRGVNLAGAATFGVGQDSIVIPSLESAKKGFAYTGPGVRVQLTPGKGTSRVAFVLQVDDTQVAMPEPEGDLKVSYVNGDFSAVGTVRLADDGFKPPKRGQYLEPPFSLVSVGASLKDGAKDALSIKGAFRTAGVAPPFGPDLHIKFGTYDVRISSADFTQAGSKWIVRETGAASRSITFDYAKGAISIVLKGIEVGNHASGPDPVRMIVEFTGVFFEDTPHFASNGKSLKY